MSNEKGSFPMVRIHFQWVPATIAKNRPALMACPVDAISKEPKYGAVLIDKR